MPSGCFFDCSLPRSPSCPQADKPERVSTQSAHIDTHTAETIFRKIFLRSIQFSDLASGHLTTGNVIKRLARLYRYVAAGFLKYKYIYWSAASRRGVSKAITYCDPVLPNGRCRRQAS